MCSQELGVKRNDKVNDCHEYMCLNFSYSLCSLIHTVFPIQLNK
jgi:hypothetical protein